MRNVRTKDVVRQLDYFLDLGSVPKIKKEILKYKELLEGKIND